MHNLQLTEDQELIVDTVRKFVADVVAPNVIDNDERRTFARAEFDGLAELGLFGLAVGEDSGGADMGMVPLVASLECIGAQSGSLARLFIGQVQSAVALEAAGAAEPLEAVMMGSSLAVFLGAEHGFAVNADKLTGTAELVPGGAEAALLVVAATDHGEPVLVTVDAAATARESLRSLGVASAAPARVGCDGVAATVIARGAEAAEAIAAAHRVALIGTAAAAVGGGQAALEVARKHAAERVAFGKPLLVQQAVQQKLIESSQRLDAARQLAWQAARLCDIGEGAFESAGQARLLAVDAEIHAADEAIQIMGGYGYTVEYHAERHYRDGMTFEVLDGGSAGLSAALGAALAP